MKRMLPAVLVVLLMACNKKDDNPNAINAMDRNFILQMYAINKIEIQSAQAPLSQSNNNSIQRLAKATFMQFMSAQSDLLALAKEIKFDLSDTASENQQSMFETINTNGYTDVGFIKANVQTLQSAMNLFQKELNEGNNTYLQHYYINKYVSGTKDLYWFADSLSKSF